MSRAGLTDPTVRSVSAPPPEEEDLAVMAEFAPHKQAAAAAGPTEVAPSSTQFATSLSPEALMAYCESRLQSLDDQMNGIFQTQTANAATTQDVNHISSLMNDLPPPSPTDTSGNVTVSSQDKANIDSAYATAINSVQGNPTLRASLVTDQAAFDSDAGSGTLTADQMTNLTGNLKNDAAGLNSDSEMTMITLQSLMSQRQTAVQLTTNLVQSLGDQQSSIAKNIGQ
jgi:hypothetical protein